ncbi:MAG TPA: hypothetical protein VF538_04340 [Pyrinomonadaceae bacterium]|jgi:hypothetical protein
MLDWNTDMTVLKALLIATLCLSLSGCDVVFINPLIDPKDAVADTRLVGKWSVPDSPLHEKGYIDIKQSGRKLIIASAAPKKLKDKLMKEFYTISCGEKNFIVAAYTGRVGKGEQKGYLVIRYRLENDSLKLWLAVPAMFKAAVEAGRLHGKAGEAFDSTIIVEPTNEASKFLCSSDDQMFEYFGEVKRVRASPDNSLNQRRGQEGTGARMPPEESQAQGRGGRPRRPRGSYELW